MGRRKEMQRSRRYLVVAGSALALAAGGAGVAMATGADEGDNGVSGPAAEKATAAALRVTDGGHANAVERDSEDGATWEVEVAKNNGSTVDVRLDQNYRLVVVEGDSEDSGGDR
jgi:hypothetical protein